MVPFCFVSLQNTSRYGSHPFRGCLGMLLKFFNMNYRQAWKQLGDMEADQAMQEYIACINVLDPEGSTKVTTNL